MITFKEWLEEYKATAKKKISRAFEAGKAQGGGYDEGFEAGKKAELAEQWEKRRLSIGSILSYAFAGRSWNDELLETISFDIKPSGSASAMFSNSGVNDLKGTLEKAGRVLDLSGATNVNNMFQNSLVTHLPKIDFSKCTATTTVFSGCTNLISIEELIPSPTAVTNNMFQTCKKLVHCIYGGPIQKTITMADCVLLDAESIDSVFNNLGSANAGQTFTFPPTAQETYDAKYREGAFQEKVDNAPSNWAIGW